MKKLQAIVLIVLTGIFLAFNGCTKKEAPKTGHTHEEIVWLDNIDEALVLAGKQHKPVFIDFMATWCPPCRMMEDSTFTNHNVIHEMEHFITVRIDVDKQGDVANKYKSNAGKYGGIGIPNILFLSSHGDELKHPIGYKGPDELIAIMDSVLVMDQHHH